MAPLYLECSGSLKLATDIEFSHIFIYANKADTDDIRNSEMSKYNLTTSKKGEPIGSPLIFQLLHDHR
ncbi:hypothetical protein D8T57_19235 [Vibrio vulnificus]|nr:hypothetical protein D8T57_19235 [Vibrio vulnificus]